MGCKSLCCFTFITIIYISGTFFTYYFTFVLTKKEIVRYSSVFIEFINNKSSQYELMRVEYNSMFNV